MSRRKQMNCTKYGEALKELITELKEKINKSYLIRKVSRSITIAMIAMTSIAFSYFVTDDLLHLIT